MEFFRRPRIGWTPGEPDAVTPRAVHRCASQGDLSPSARGSRAPSPARGAVAEPGPPGRGRTGRPRGSGRVCTMNRMGLSSKREECGRLVGRLSSQESRRRNRLCERRGHRRPADGSRHLGLDAVRARLATAHRGHEGEGLQAGQHLTAVLGARTTRSSTRQLRGFVTVLRPSRPTRTMLRPDSGST